MTSRISDAWRAQSPEGEFAERTVAAILRDRSSTRRRARSARWWGAMGIAAVLVAAGAWARLAIPKVATSEASEVSAVQSATVVTAPVSSSHAPPAREASPDAPLRTMPLASPPRRPRDPAPTPSAGHKPRVPLCNCAGTICDCGEEP